MHMASSLICPFICTQEPCKLCSYPAWLHFLLGPLLLTPQEPASSLIAITLLFSIIYFFFPQLDMLGYTDTLLVHVLTPQHSFSIVIFSFSQLQYRLINDITHGVDGLCKKAWIATPCKLLSAPTQFHLILGHLLLIPSIYLAPLPFQLARIPGLTHLASHHSDQAQTYHHERIV